MNKIFYVLVMLTFIYVAAAVTIVGFKTQAVITEVHKQLDTMWSEIEIVRDQTYSMYIECK